MANTVTIDLRQVARGLDVPLRQIQAAVELLDEGNTVPFITRYRKDQTGGLDEEQVREIQSRLSKSRMLADRKQTILRSIESQGKLTEKLSKQIHSAATTKRLEDLYLPYKPKKQTLATLARSRGLEPLTREILEADPACADLDARAADFANPDRQVPTAADALLGAGHILAEQFSERAELRGRLREILHRTGIFVSSRIGCESKVPSPAAEKPEKPAPPAEPAAAAEVEPAPAVEASPEPAAETDAPPPNPAADDPAPEAVAEVPGVSQSEPPVEAVAAPAGDSPPAAKPVARQAKAKAQAKAARLDRKESKKKRLEEMRIKAFRDYFDYRDEIKKIPPHRVLAINRGERAKVLRVKIEADIQAMYNALDELLVPPEHPHADYLRGCARDALARLILPSLERDIRRELTDRAEAHAVGVFAKNLRNLLLQPPVHNQRVLAVDPGFRSGCKLAALDQFGNVLAHDVIFLVGKPDRRQEARQKATELVERYELSVVAIGNGTACRQTEDFFAELVAGPWRDRGVAYVVVNEAGASVYSTSRLGREEFPDYDASLRGAISIGRRLEDPLSELVKIDAANIGVGLYQHDVKAKHLRTSLDEVVESCVNYVGVDVNTASPALLSYVSGLNQLTARRVYEYRRQNGPFRNREQLRGVPGFGEATFVQAAGFLKITGGDNPLDATWIHPESYEAASRLLERLGGSPAASLAPGESPGAKDWAAAVDIDAMSAELGVGTLTLRDILAQFARPGRDPREDLPAPIFRHGVLKLEDLSPAMELTGTVLNVVDFGAFVDIGMHDSGLVHVSRLSTRYVRDPHEVIAVGEVVKVWVLEVDKERRRVSLTMIPPGTPSEHRPHREAKSDRAGDGRQQGSRPPRKPRPAQAQGGPPRKAPPKRHAPPKPHHAAPKPKPKPQVPITDAMKSGKQPMRTFGDLMQFFEEKKPPESDDA